jgi:protein-tyrosine-phosphatase
VNANGPKLVLFLCVENACRSLIAESGFNADPPPGWKAVSAGTRPGSRPHGRTHSMLVEVGLALPDHGPQAVTPEMIDAASIHVTMGSLDDDACPARLKTMAVRDWGLPDPAGLDDRGFRQVRDEILARTRALAQEIAQATSGDSRGSVG